MANYQELGLQIRDGVPISLVDEHQKPLPFLNPRSLADPNNHDINFVTTKPQDKWNIAIPIQVHQVPEWFFPDDASRFTVGTDDEKTFECRFVDQGTLSGLHFTRNVDHVQQYFRKRLHVSFDVRVTSSDFTRYGTDSFLMFRLEEAIYFLDFSSSIGNDMRRIILPSSRDIILETKWPQYASQRAQKEARIRGLPFYPGRLDNFEPLPSLPYNLGEMIVVRHSTTAAGSIFQVTLERMPN